jgi:hypothetical protein
LCGGVKYEVRGAPMIMYHCHCGTCRKASGSSFATNILVRGEDFVIVSGEDLLSAFESSPKKHRHFCSACGSPIFSRAEATAQVVSVRSGTLDADPGVRPAFHAHVASKAAWTEIRDELPQAAESFG